jgi:hypothetical protein
MIMLNRIRTLYATEPARVVAVLVGLVLAVASQLGLVVDADNVGESIALLLLVAVGGEATRAKVSPATGLIGPDSDALLPPEVRAGPTGDDTTAV